MYSAFGIKYKRFEHQNVLEEEESETSDQSEGELQPDDLTPDPGAPHPPGHHSPPLYIGCWTLHSTTSIWRSSE